MYSALIHSGFGTWATIPHPTHTHTHTQLFFLEERVNMCELHYSLELFLVYQKGN